jgi:hypothetical protein
MLRNHRRTIAVLELEFAERSLELHDGAERDVLQDALEGGVAKARGHLDDALARRAGDGEAAGVALRIGLGWFVDGDVDELPGGVVPVRWLLEAERHRAIRHQLTTDERRRKDWPIDCWFHNCFQC